MKDYMNLFNTTEQNCLTAMDLKEEDKNVLLKLMGMPAKELIDYLNSSGINTVYSIIDNMSIKCQITLESDIKRIYDLVWAFLYIKKEIIDFKIEVIHSSDDGRLSSTMNIIIGK